MGRYWLVSAFVVVVTLCLHHTGLEAKPSKQPSSPTDGCGKYFVDGKGDFKLEKKYYYPQRTGFYIRSIELKKRLSFYTCIPEEIKYGVEPDGSGWWVDKGCEAIFQVVECPRDEGPRQLLGPVRIVSANSEFLRDKAYKQIIISGPIAHIQGTEERFQTVPYKVL